MLGVGSAGPLGPGPRSRPEDRAGGTSSTATGGSAAIAPGHGCGPPGRELTTGSDPDDDSGKPIERPVTVRPATGRPTEREAWAILAAADGIGPVTFGILLARYGTARAVLRAARVRGGRGMGPREARGADPLLDRRVADAVRAADDDATVLLASIRRAGVRIVTAADLDYPRRLRAIELPPPVLYLAGPIEALEREAAVAVVGTRRPSETGRRDAARIAGSIARTDAAVISGLAVGIDGVAHMAALDESGTTVAVLGSGHVRLAPVRHRPLADRILRSGGAIVSELPPLTDGARHTFPRRNRIISGLADAVVVAEAGAGSGALITAAWALEQGRECFLVPGAIDAPASAGCLRFLRDHHGLARIVVGVAELIAELGLHETRPDPTAAADLGPIERAIAERLVERPSTLDELVAVTASAPATILAAMSRLEVRGLAVDVFGRYRPAGRLATRGAEGLLPAGTSASPPAGASASPPAVPRGTAPAGRSATP
jgi:DNA processing protein